MDESAGGFQDKAHHIRTDGSAALLPHHHIMSAVEMAPRLIGHKTVMLVSKCYTSREANGNVTCLLYPLLEFTVDFS